MFAGGSRVAEGSGAPRPPARARGADAVLLTEARLPLVPPGADPAADAVLVACGHVVALGRGAQLRGLLPPGGRVRTLHGCALIPGLTDAHVHLEAVGLALQQLDCAAGSIEELQDRLRARAAVTGADGWLLGRGWDQDRFRERRLPTAADLEAAAPGRRVLLHRYCGHIAVASPAALAAAGIGPRTLDPPSGVIDRRPDGTPTGVLRERAIGLVGACVPAPTDAERARALMAAARAALRYGITSAHSMDAWEAGEIDAAAERWRGLWRDGVRLRGYLLWPAADAERLRRAGLGTGAGDRRVRLGPAKLFADGSLGGSTAALLEPYADGSGDRGVLMYAPEELADLVWQLHASGQQLAIHAIGDRAVDAVLTALRAALAALPRPDHRHRLIHLQVLAPRQLAELRAAGVVADLQPKFCTSDGWWAPARLGPGRLGLAYPLASLLAAGVPACAGSDAPVEPLDPWLGIEAAVRREDPQAGVCGEWLRRQAVDVLTALRLYTEGAAYAEFAERWKGGLFPGALADLVVLDRDPRDAPPPELRRVRALCTLVEGEPAHGEWP